MACSKSGVRLGFRNVKNIKAIDGWCLQSSWDLEKDFSWFMPFSPFASS